MRLAVISFVLGIVVGCFSLHYYNNKNQNKITSEIITINQKGKDIDHFNWNTSGKNITFETKSKGKGTMKTVIPKKLIPEANYWITKKNSIQANVFLQLKDKEVFNYYGVSYWRRYNLVSIGGGVIFSGESFGVQVGSQFWW